jgi:hypothetical protein
MPRTDGTALISSWHGKHNVQLRKRQIEINAVPSVLGIIECMGMNKEAD